MSEKLWSFVRTLPHLEDSWSEEVQDWVLRDEAEQRIAELEAKNKKLIGDQFRSDTPCPELLDRYTALLERLEPLPEKWKSGRDYSANYYADELESIIKEARDE